MGVAAGEKPKAEEERSRWWAELRKWTSARAWGFGFRPSFGLGFRPSERFVAVLEIPPLKDAQTAVKVAIAAEAKNR